MRRLIWLMLIPLCAKAQDASAIRQIERFKACNDLECQLSQSVRMAEFYVETDHMEKAQDWLDYAKKLHRSTPKDSIAYFLNSLQSETFYYMELYQFALHETEKGIEKAKALKDSLFLSDAYFFKGINEIEINALKEAEQSLWLSKTYQPKRTQRKHLRTMIVPAYIYNNLAQLKLRKHALDSALYYNRKSYALAQKDRVFRGIVNGEQTFGLIYAEQKRQDSAVFYLDKSLASAVAFGLEDVATLNCALLMQVHRNDPQKVRQFYDRGLQFIANNEVNNSYQRNFYAIAVTVFKTLGNVEQVLWLQDKIIAANATTNQRANYYVQSISERYMANENKLLVSRINELDQERNIRILQLVAALFGFLVLLFVALFFRRKNKLQQSLLEQKNEISKDLHDDIGSELSSILIHANLLATTSAEEKQRQLADRISATTAEISQRLNAFIWSLSNEHDRLPHFIDYVKRYAARLLEESHIELRLLDHTQGSDPATLNGYWRKNVFFCLKEALNNAIRHAAPNTISVEFVLEGKTLLISVSDDGRGMETQNVFGNGFRNMERRISALGGTVRYSYARGFSIHFSLPI